MALFDQFIAYSNWRNGTIDAVERLRTWLDQNEIGDAQGDLRLQFLQERLRDDKLSVAFVAEFSRGKSELINALFFADYGTRILPSSTGRTTMCPTELQWSKGDRPEIRLLPIETRATHTPVSEYKRYPEEWQVLPLDPTSASDMQQALARVGETRLVPATEAMKLGFTIDRKGEKGLKPDAQAMVEIPCWRHALILFPNPLLEQGLVVMDTPGLNAIGAEPELTVSLLPHAHAILFVLGVDTGVTQSDLAVWREFVQVGKGPRRGRLVVLNKIDSLWDGLRDEASIDKEINRQVESASRTLEVGQDAVFPISAQKALVARINKDEELLARSRIGALEHALSQDLLPTRKEIARDNTLGETGDVIGQARDLLKARLVAVREQLQELTELRGKNQGVIEYMMRKIRTEKEEFEQGLQKYYAVRSVFTNLTNNLLGHLGLDAIRSETRRTRAAMQEAAFSAGLRDAMVHFFEHLRGNLKRSSDEIDEIMRMLEAMYKRFSVEHGLNLKSPSTFSTLRYQKDIDRLERNFEQQIKPWLNVITTGKHSLTHQFFETVALEARRTFEAANRDVEHWLRAVMSPLETQVREYQLQLKRRLDSVKRIHEATDTLEERVVELQQSETVVLKQLQELEGLELYLAEVCGSAATTEPAALASQVA